MHDSINPIFFEGNEITAELGKIAIAVEAYPDLKSGENFLMLQRRMNEIEEQLSASRRAFNVSVPENDHQSS